MMRRLSQRLSAPNWARFGNAGSTPPPEPAVTAGANELEGSTTHPWPGYKSIRNLFIFGDSYSAIGFTVHNPPPKKVDRRKTPFKGLTYADSDGTNWVGYLLSQRRMHPDLLVHDYAVGGACVPARGFRAALETQVNRDFLDGYAMKTTKDGSLPWNAADSLFVTWIGINDCAYAETHEETLDLLFTLQEKLYTAGARIFLFIDVPPIGRSPAGINASSDISATYTNWNVSLASHIQDFTSAHPDARVLTFSAFDSFNRLLDSAEFTEDDRRMAGGKVWRDRLHPTSRVHEIFAADVVAFFEGVDKNSA
ncbi:hypothetical protein FB45DRAFT_932763 [Roridomyces roridus]|uniref:Carbohydrate esterase family 16 protein n=1 Tax=Roridomyces roridus TaxID=1738132 RepID=A0AAD7FFY5_9AGAR|nr:hypothetical protein FB45DRAFT_932763 [Roridomyces roridus]